MARHRPVDDTDRHHPAAPSSATKPPAHHVRKAHQELFELSLRARRASHDVGVAVALARHAFEVAALEPAQPPQPGFRMLRIPPGAMERLRGRTQEPDWGLNAGE